MTVQFIYPAEDNILNSGVWVSQDNSHSPLYTLVDEGVASPNDADYIQQSGLPVPLTADLRLGLDPVLVTPLDAILRYRASNASGDRIDLTPTLFDNAGNTLITFPSTEVSGDDSFRDYEINFTSIVDEGDWSSPLLFLTHSGVNNVSGIQDLNISAMEIEVSGAFDYISQNRFNLFLSSKEPSYLSGEIPLFIYVSTESGVLALNKSLELFLDGRIDNSGLMNLYIRGQNPVLNDTSNMNLYLECGNTFTDYIPLFLQNSFDINSGNITLFMQGPTFGSSGTVPSSGYMPLFISRSSESMERRLTLFIDGPSGINNNFNLFLEGQPNTRSGIPMYLDARAQDFTSSLRLYTHGF